LPQMELELARSAVNDLKDIKAYYRDQEVPEIGEDMVASILDRFQMLADHPDAGRQVPEFDREEIRELIHPPFRVVYLRQQSLITLIRVWRSERLLKLP